MVFLALAPLNKPTKFGLKKKETTFLFFFIFYFYPFLKKKETCIAYHIYISQKKSTDRIYNKDNKTT